MQIRTKKKLEYMLLKMELYLMDIKIDFISFEEKKILHFNKFLLTTHVNADLLRNNIKKKYAKHFLKEISQRIRNSNNNNGDIFI